MPVMINADRKKSIHKKERENGTKNDENQFLGKIFLRCGDLGCNIIYSAMSAFLLFYYTDYVHISAGIVGTIMLVSRIFDGVTDLIMGVIVDRTKSKMGKCRPWILRMAIPFAIADPPVQCTVRIGADREDRIHFHYI